MAQATVFTAARMKQIEDKSVVNGSIVNDNLVLTRNDGSTIQAGNVRGPQGIPGNPGNPGTPGTRVDLSRPWDSTTTYVVDDVVGYGGRVWKATGNNLDKPPAFNTNVWKSVTGLDVNAWVERDPNFTGNNVLASHEIFWGGGTRSYAMTSVAGEFETGFQALKLTLGTSSNQWVSSLEENVVLDNEKIVIRVRAKLLAASAGAKFRAMIIQNGPGGYPGPFVSGSVNTEPVEGTQDLTTAWATYTFTVTTVPGKPRVRANAIFETGANAANIVIDYIRISRVPIFVDPTMKAYSDAADTALGTRLTAVEALVPTAQVSRYFPLALSNFTTSGMVTVTYFPNGKRVSMINYQIVRTTSNYGVIPSSSWVYLGIITNAAARYSGTISFYTIGWINALEGALPCSINYDNATGNVYVKAIPGITTTMNIGHFIQFSLVVNEP